MDPLGFRLSTIPEFRDPVDEFSYPIEDFRDAVKDSKDSIDKLRDLSRELQNCIVGKESSYDLDNAKPLVKKSRRLLDREVRVGVKDGRMFVGKLHCFDKQKNIILYDAVEFRSFPGRGAVGVEAKQAAEQRSLGLVLIPAWCRTSCYVKCFLDEKMNFLNISS